MTTTKISVAHAPRTKPEFPPKIWPENYGLYTTKSSCFASQSEAVVGLLPTEKAHRGVLGAVVETVAGVIGTAEVVTGLGIAQAAAIDSSSVGVCLRLHRMMRQWACWSTT